MKRKILESVRNSIRERKFCKSGSESFEVQKCFWIVEKVGWEKVGWEKLKSNWNVWKHYDENHMCEKVVGKIWQKFGVKSHMCQSGKKKQIGFIENEVGKYC